MRRNTSALTEKITPKPQKLLLSPSTENDPERPSPALLQRYGPFCIYSNDVNQMMCDAFVTPRYKTRSAARIRDEFIDHPYCRPHDFWEANNA